MHSSKVDLISFLSTSEIPPWPASASQPTRTAFLKTIAAACRMPISISGLLHTRRITSANPVVLVNASICRSAVLTSVRLQDIIMRKHSTSGFIRSPKSVIFSAVGQLRVQRSNVAKYKLFPIRSSKKPVLFKKFFFKLFFLFSKTRNGVGRSEPISSCRPSSVCSRCQTTGTTGSIFGTWVFVRG